MLRVGLDSIGPKDHRGCGDSASGVAEGAILRHAAERVIPPAFIALTERGNRKLHAMKKVSPAAGCERSFPMPVDKNSGRAGNERKEKEENEAFQKKNSKCTRRDASMG